jgi:hypothetical protein
MADYQPELGQAAFGCPVGEFECPLFIEAGLMYLAREIELSEWNRTQKQFDAPVVNNGGEFKTGEFAMHAYYWGDDEALEARPNFKCGDFEVRWYKYLGRGMSMNRDIDANDYFAIIEKCVGSLHQLQPDVDYF